MRHGGLVLREDAGMAVEEVQVGLRTFELFLMECLMCVMAMRSNSLLGTGDARNDTLAILLGEYLTEMRTCILVSDSLEHYRRIAGRYVAAAESMWFIPRRVSRRNVLWSLWGILLTIFAVAASVVVSLLGLQLVLTGITGRPSEEVADLLDDLLTGACLSVSLFLSSLETGVTAVSWFPTLAEGGLIMVVLGPLLAHTGGLNPMVVIEAIRGGVSASISAATTFSVGWIAVTSVGYLVVHIFRQLPVLVTWLWWLGTRVFVHTTRVDLSSNRQICMARAAFRDLAH